MVLERVPEDHQQVSIRRFDATVDLVATKAGRIRDYGLHATADGRVEGDLLTWAYADVDHFQDHMSLRWWLIESSNSRADQE